MESILTSIKKMLGLTEDYEHFDVDIIMHINSTFRVLNQLGVGPSKAFRIVDDGDTWSDFMPEDCEGFDEVKTYVYQRVKLLFDPPLSSSHLTALKESIAEFEWRLQVESESRIENQNGVNE